MPADAGRVATRGRNPIAIAADVERLVELGSQHLPSLAAIGASPDLLKRGSTAAAALREADAAQDLARRADAPEAVRLLRELAATVHLAVVTLNALARDVHAGDPTRASPYHMKVLYRRMVRPANGAEAPAAGFDPSGAMRSAPLSVGDRTLSACAEQLADGGTFRQQFAAATQGTQFLDAGQPVLPPPVLQPLHPCADECGGTTQVRRAPTEHAHGGIGVGHALAPAAHYFREILRPEDVGGSPAKQGPRRLGLGAQANERKPGDDIIISRAIRLLQRGEIFDGDDAEPSPRRRHRLRAVPADPGPARSAARRRGSRPDLP
jgi:hypothetical protein